MPTLIQQVRQLLESIQRYHDDDHTYIEWLEETHRHLYPDIDIYTAYEKATGIFAEEE